MFYSAYNQDLLVNGLLDGKRDGVFVDIGACEGEYVSNTCFFEREKNWTGLCIESDPDTFKQLKLNRPNSVCINALIYDNENMHEFIQCPTPQFSGMASNMIEKHAGGNKIQMKSQLINNILEEYKIDEIDFLSIDAEGCEINILESIDYKKFKIEVICFEINDSMRGYDLNRMKERGYDIIAKLGGDLIIAKHRLERCRFFQERQYFRMDKLYTFS